MSVYLSSMTLSCEIKHVCLLKSKYIDIWLVFTYNTTFCSNLEVDLQIKFSSQFCRFNWKYWCLAFLSFQHLSFLIYKSVNKIYSWLELFNLDNFCQDSWHISALQEQGAVVLKIHFQFLILKMHHTEWNNLKCFQEPSLDIWMAFN